MLLKVSTPFTFLFNWITLTSINHIGGGGDETLYAYQNYYFINMHTHCCESPKIIWKGTHFDSSSTSY